MNLRKGRMIKETINDKIIALIYGLALGLTCNKNMMETGIIEILQGK